MKAYMIIYENHTFDWDFDYRIEGYEFYLDEATAEKRQADLQYMYSHGLDEDDNIVELNEEEQEGQEKRYEFVLEEIDIKEINQKELPPVKVW